MFLRKAKKGSILASVLFISLLLSGCVIDDFVPKRSDKGVDATTRDNSKTSVVKSETDQEVKTVAPTEDRGKTQAPQEDAGDGILVEPGERVEDENQVGPREDRVVGEVEKPVDSQEDQGVTDAEDSAVGEIEKPVDPQEDQEVTDAEQPSVGEGEKPENPQEDQEVTDAEQPSVGEAGKPENPQEDQEVEDVEDPAVGKGETPADTQEDQEVTDADQPVEAPAVEEMPGVVVEEGQLESAPEVECDASQGLHKLTFNLNGGEGKVLSQCLRNGETISAPWEGFTMEGGKFRGWNYGKHEEGLVRHVPGGSFTMRDSDVTLYAVWQILDTRTFDGYERLKGKTLWAKGIIPPREDEWRPIRLHTRGNKTVVWSPGVGWYDTDQFSDFMCWGATTSSALHWWLDQNKDYVERYLKYTNKTLPPHEYRHARDSDLYGLMKRTFGNHGNKSDLAFLWFISGVSVKEGGGYFSDVFAGKIIKSLSYHVTQKSFNETVTEAFENEKLVSRISAGHATVVWGARYNDKGLIDRIYYTQSNDYRYSHVDSPKREKSGLLYLDVYYIDGYPYTPSIVDGFDIEFEGLITYSLGRDIWEEYFKNHPEGM